MITLIFVFAAGCVNQQLRDFFNTTEMNPSVNADGESRIQSALDGPSTGWIEVRAEAMAQAERYHKVVLANFTGSDWCHWCQKLDEEVLDTPQFKQWANDRVVLLKLDFPEKSQQPPGIRAQNKQLAQTYAEYIKGYPTVLFLDASGQVLGKLGYVQGGPEAWIRAAEQQLGRDVSP